MYARSCNLKSLKCIKLDPEVYKVEYLKLVAEHNVITQIVSSSGTGKQAVPFFNLACFTNGFRLY